MHVCIYVYMYIYSTYLCIYIAPICMGLAHMHIISCSEYE